MFVNTKELSALCDLTDPLQANVDKGLLVGKIRQGWRMLQFKLPWRISKKQGGDLSWYLHHHRHLSVASPFALFKIYFGQIDIISQERQRKDLFCFCVKNSSKSFRWSVVKGKFEAGSFHRACCLFEEFFLLLSISWDKLETSRSWTDLVECIASFQNIPRFTEAEFANSVGQGRWFHCWSTLAPSKPCLRLSPHTALHVLTSVLP